MDTLNGYLCGIAAFATAGMVAWNVYHKSSGQPSFLPAVENTLKTVKIATATVSRAQHSQPTSPLIMVFLGCLLLALALVGVGLSYQRYHSKPLNTKAKGSIVETSKVAKLKNAVNQIEEQFQQHLEKCKQEQDDAAELANKLQNRFDDSKIQASDLQKELQDSETDQVNLAKRLEKSNKDRDTALDSAKGYKKSLHGAATFVDGLQKQLHAFMTTHEAENVEARAKNEKLQAENSKIQKEHLRMLKNTSNLEAQMTKLQGEMALSQNELEHSRKSEAKALACEKKAETQITKLQDQMAISKKKLEHSRKDEAKALADSKTAETKMSDMQLDHAREVKFLEMELEQSKTEITHLAEKSSETENRYKAKILKMKEGADENAHAAISLKLIKNKQREDGQIIQQLRSKLSKAQQEKNPAIWALESTKDELSKLTIVAAGVQAENDSTKDELSELKIVAADTQAENSQLQADVLWQASEISRARSSVESLKRSLKHAQREILSQTRDLKAEHKIRRASARWPTITQSPLSPLPLTTAPSPQSPTLLPQPLSPTTPSLPSQVPLPPSPISLPQPPSPIPPPPSQIPLPPSPILLPQPPSPIPPPLSQIPQPTSPMQLTQPPIPSPISSPPSVTPIPPSITPSTAPNEVSNPPAQSPNPFPEDPMDVDGDNDPKTPSFTPAEYRSRSNGKERGQVPQLPSDQGGISYNPMASPISHESSAATQHFAVPTTVPPRIAVCGPNTTFNTPVTPLKNFSNPEASQATAKTPRPTDPDQAKPMKSPESGLQEPSMEYWRRICTCETEARKMYKIALKKYKAKVKANAAANNSATTGNETGAGPAKVPQGAPIYFIGDFPELPEFDDDDNIIRKEPNADAMQDVWKDPRGDNDTTMGGCP